MVTNSPRPQRALLVGTGLWRANTQMARKIPVFPEDCCGVSFQFGLAVNEVRHEISAEKTVSRSTFFQLQPLVVVKVGSAGAKVATKHRQKNRRDHVLAEETEAVRGSADRMFVA